jgi:hypothetical protein
MNLEFGRYLFREFTWELEQHPGLVTVLRGVSSDDVELLDYSGYDCLDVRSGGEIFRLHLTWNGKAEPHIEPLSATEKRQKLPSNDVKALQAAETSEVELT